MTAGDSPDDGPEPEVAVGFSVDTGLFRQLGELLVGRDATALVELVKNAYDADATEVVVSAMHLESDERGVVQIADNGLGMTDGQFRRGFLRVAGRTKLTAQRASPVYMRRYTGEKGVGRLAAHKLAREVEVTSVAAVELDGTPAAIGLRRSHGDLAPGDLSSLLQQSPRALVEARIDWEAVEQVETLDQVGEHALSVSSRRLEKPAPLGTTITLSRLRRSWSVEELAEVSRQLYNFEPPDVLGRRLPSRMLSGPPLFDQPTVRDAHRGDPGMRLRLEGDFGLTTDYWPAVERGADWVLEIDASRGVDTTYAVIPTASQTASNQHSRRFEARAPHPSPDTGPFFQARILLRSGGAPTLAERAWVEQSSGVRVYLEGFRVLPYGEAGNDWLRIDLDYTRRSGRLEMNPLLAGRDDDMTTLRELSARDVSLRLLPNRAFFGGVFLTETGAGPLRTLVNREGFVPDEHYERLVSLVRRGTDLLLRARALASYQDAQRRAREAAEAKERARAARIAEAALAAAETGDDRAPDDEVTTDDTAGDSSLAMSGPKGAWAGGTDEHPHDQDGSDDDPPDPEAWRTGREGSAARLLAAVRGLRDILAVTPEAADAPVDEQAVNAAADAVAAAADSLIGDTSLLRVLASVGAQLAAFHHEMQHLLPSARDVERYLAPRPGASFPEGVVLARRDMTQLRRGLERQASYLADVVSAESRERRTRQLLRDRFDVARRTVQGAAAQRDIEVVNEIPADLRTPPMFPAEVLAVLSNLLTNAVKAAGTGGRVRASGMRGSSGVELLLENTGARVEPREGERWFVPFASSSAVVDTTLGQGTGLGLPITRDLLAEYGSTVHFAVPSDGFATAVKVVFVD